MQQLNYNPFYDAGITNYEQYKKYPFLIFGVLEQLKNRIAQQGEQITNNIPVGERLILLGERGIGKTSTLFFIRDMLLESMINTHTLSILPTDKEHYELLVQEVISSRLTTKVIPIELIKETKKATYILIDFPDTIDSKNYKKFLEFLWSLLTHKNYQNVNLVFTMNQSHYEKSFNYSEIFGKFITIHLERFNREETEQLIESRLKLSGKRTEEVFSQEIINTVFSYSKGIPRNIISASNLLISSVIGQITKEQAEEILKEKYIDQVINDRVTDLELRPIFKNIVGILKNDFNGTTNSQEDYVKRITEVTGIGRNSAIDRINDLVKFGILTRYRGGYNRLNKIISLE